MYLLITKINNFRGDLSDISAKLATLVGIYIPVTKGRFRIPSLVSSVPISMKTSSFSIKVIMYVNGMISVHHRFHCLPSPKLRWYELLSCTYAGCQRCSRYMCASDPPSLFCCTQKSILGHQGISGAQEYDVHAIWVVPSGDEHSAIPTQRSPWFWNSWGCMAVNAMPPGMKSDVVAFCIFVVSDYPTILRRFLYLRNSYRHLDEITLSNTLWTASQMIPLATRSLTRSFATKNTTYMESHCFSWHIG